MINHNDGIYVTSHIGRDLLQSAALFKHERQVVWEYVSNGLEYVDTGTQPVVKVRLNQKANTISVTDNGRGMDWAGLQNYFVMHGENIDRKKGRPGRGYFGTGKSAAFGIGEVLKVTSVRQGRRSSVELHKDDIKSMDTGDPVPVREIEREVKTSEPNGTIIKIEGIKLKKLDQSSVMRFIERHIARWPNSTVWVNTHECQYAEPDISKEFSFLPHTDELKEKLGNVVLKIKLSKTPLESEFQGISIYSKGIWHETTLAGSDGKEFCQYIFGEIDVPALMDDESEIPAFDMSRSMVLNRSNNLVLALMSFIGFHIEKVRKELVEEDIKRQESDNARKLAEEANKIADIINQHFNEYRDKLKKMKAKMAGAGDILPGSEGADEDEIQLAEGGNIPADIVEDEGDLGRGEGVASRGEEPPDLGPIVELGNEESDYKAEVAGTTGKGRRTRGGFCVEFKEMGESEKRALYEKALRLILINLDHPQIATASSAGGIEDIAFQRLSYEVAFCEYAIALAYEMDEHGWFLDSIESVQEVRETLDRIARMAADMYRV